MPRYSQGFKDRAIRMINDRLDADRSCTQWRAIKEIAPELGVATETLRWWYEQWLIDTGERAGVTSEENAEIKRLKREVAELRRANEFLKTASAFSLPSQAVRPDDDRLYRHVQGSFRGRADLPGTRLTLSRWIHHRTWLPVS